MLRPATPLTIIFVISFVFLLLSTLSSPVIASIPLATFHDYSFGVFGFCKSDGSTCHGPKLGYDSNPKNSPQSFSLPVGARAALSYILIVHPIAAFATLICAILAFASHFSGPAHSTRFLLALLILSFPTFLLALLTFLVDILLFIPNLAWAGWISLPATILIAAGSVLTCAMRRTVVSRKARKQRIADNPEMSGQNYYAMREEPSFKQPSDSQYARADSPPPMDNQVTTGASTDNKGPAFAAYEYGRSTQSLDDRTPLNNREPSIRTMSTSGARSQRHAEPRGPSNLGPSDRTFPPPEAMYDGAPRSRSESRSRNVRGGQAPSYGRENPPPQMYSRGRGFPPRGPPPPRGYYPPRGAPPQRGRGGPPPGWVGYGRGGPAPRSRGPPPYGYYNRRPSSRTSSYSQEYYQQQEAGMGYYGERSSLERSQGQWPMQQQYGYEQPVSPLETPEGVAVGGVERQASPALAGRASPYARSASASSQTRDPNSFGFSGRRPSPARSAHSPRSQSPPPPVPPLNYTNVPPGQAVEMDAASGSPAPSPRLNQDSSQFSSQHLGEAAPRGDHSTGTYLPRSAWQTEPIEMSASSPPRHAEPTAISNTVNNTEPFARAGHTPPPQALDSHMQLNKQRSHTASETYYEDVDPRFSEDPNNPTIDPNIPTIQHQDSSEVDMPTSLMPGYLGPGSPSPGSPSPQPPIDDSHLYHSGMEEQRDDSRSPAHSEGSNFTSISQRGINPNWQPGPSVSPAWGGPAPAGYGSDPRGQQARRWREQDNILNANPDFFVPGAGLGRRARGGSGSAGVVPTSGHVRGMSSGGSHRYPDPV